MKTDKANIDEGISIKRFLPRFMGENPELSALFSAVDEQLIPLREGIDELFLASFPVTADNENGGLIRHARVLGISIDEGATEEEIREEILLTLMCKTPYTYRSLNKALSLYFGEGWNKRPNGEVCDILVEHEDYRVYVYIGAHLRESFNVVRRFVEKIIPANMILGIKTVYNTHEDLKKIRHYSLTYERKLTHDKVRTEALKK